MNQYPKQGQTCHAHKEAANHEGENVIGEAAVMGYNHGLNERKELLDMAVQFQTTFSNLRLLEKPHRLSLKEKAIFLTRAISNPSHYQRRLKHLTALKGLESPLTHWVEGLISEYEKKDYCHPVTEWGAMEKVRRMARGEFLEWFSGLEPNGFEHLMTITDINGFYDTVLNLPLNERERQRFYRDSGLHVTTFFNGFPDNQGHVFDKCRDALVPCWAEFTNPAPSGDMLQGFIEELLEFPVDLLCLLAESITALEGFKLSQKEGG